MTLLTTTMTMSFSPLRNCELDSDKDKQHVTLSSSSKQSPWRRSYSTSQIHGPFAASVSELNASRILLSVISILMSGQLLLPL